MRTLLQLLFLAGLLLATAGCDRRVEPYVEEQPHKPDLSKIFPAGAEEAKREAVPAMPPAPGGPPAQASGEPVSGSVRVAPEFAGRVRADAVLFVIARSGSAGPPLAVKRIENPHFPVAFVIGPDDRMIKAMPFVGPIRLTARLDRDGNATTRSPGDLQGAAPEPVSPGTGDVEIVLDEAL
jgi:hypothetical protein